MKIITERKWSKLFDEHTECYGKKLENGLIEYTPEELDKYFDAVENFPDDYIIISFSNILNKIKSIVKRY